MPDPFQHVRLVRTVDRMRKQLDLSRDEIKALKRTMESARDLMAELETNYRKKGLKWYGTRFHAFQVLIEEVLAPYAAKPI